MRFNASKCQIMHISRGQAQTRMYSLCNEILSTVKTAKYLGVTVSDDLQWHHQIHSVMNKANSMLHLVARNLRNCPRSTRSLAYTTLIRPKLEYSCSVWALIQRQILTHLKWSTEGLPGWFSISPGENKG